MADSPPFVITWQSVLIGVGFVVAANIIVAIIGAVVPLPGPSAIWSAIAAAVGVFAWFAFMARRKG